MVAMGLTAEQMGMYGCQCCWPSLLPLGKPNRELDKATTMITVEALTIYGGMNIANSRYALNFSHAKLVVISSDVAQTGIERYLNTFNRFREFSQILLEYP